MDTVTTMTVSKLRTVRNKDAISELHGSSDVFGEDVSEGDVTTMTVSNLRSILISNADGLNVLDDSTGNSFPSSVSSMTVSDLRMGLDKLSSGVPNGSLVDSDVVVTVSDEHVLPFGALMDLLELQPSGEDAKAPSGITESSTGVDGGQAFVTPISDDQFDFRSEKQKRREAREAVRRAERLEREQRRIARPVNPRESERVFEVITGPNYRAQRSYIPRAKDACTYKEPSTGVQVSVKSAEEFSERSKMSTITEDDFLGELVDEFDGGDEDRDGKTTGFSYRQYRSLTKCLATRKIDFVAPALLTLLYRSIDDAPEYEVAVGHMKQFATMFRSAWKRELNGVWKFESAKDGVTPHAHEYLDVPEGLSAHPTKKEHNSAKWEEFNGLVFDDWMEAVWQFISEQVPNERMPRLTDVSRRGDGSWQWVQIYFGKRTEALKHKRYQNRCPKSWIKEGKVMQLWGRHGLKELTVEVTAATAESYQKVKRVNRKLSTVTVEVADRTTGEFVEKQVKRFTSGGIKGGFVVGEFSNQSQEALRRIALGI